jgi:hypothetical protein
MPCPRQRLGFSALTPARGGAGAPPQNPPPPPPRFGKHYHWQCPQLFASNAAAHTHPCPPSRPQPPQGFGKHYFRQCPQLFASDDAAYILAYAIIMLNTDLHNNQVWACGAARMTPPGARRVWGGRRGPGPAADCLIPGARQKS